MSHRVSQPKPAEGEQTAGEASRLAATPHAGLARSLARAGRHVRVDPAMPVVNRTGSSAAGTATDVSTEFIEEFAYRNGQHFDSYLVTEPGRQLYWSPGRTGLISYVCRGRYVLVGGGLVAAPERKEELLAGFVEHLRQSKQRVAFHNIGDDDLPLFRRFGFQITKWGEEPIVDLTDCTWKGKAYEWVRRQTNYCQRHGLIAFEVRPEELTAEQWSRTLSEIHEITAEYLSRKPQSGEMRFFEGRIDNHELGLRRLFVARDAHGAGRMEGFVICNPMLNGTAWAMEMYRHRTNCVRGTVAFLVHSLMQQFQAEGVERLGMCLDPGRHCAPLPNDSRLVRWGMQFGDRYMGLIFDVSGLRHFKSRFRPRYESRYVCALPDISIGSVWAFTRTFGVFDLNYRKLARITIERLRKRVARKSLADVE